jgi:peptide/nickel transport system substrate-binding protein
VKQNSKKVLGGLASKNKLVKSSISGLHRSAHKNILKHTRRHISSRRKSLKSINTKKLILKFGSLSIATILALSLMLSSSLKSGRTTGLTGQGTIFFGIEDSSSSTQLNPLNLTSSSDLGIGGLIFSSLLTYDQGGHLKGDLAKSYTVDEKGGRISLELKDNAFWHDGNQVTSDDVAFTIQALSAPESRSSLKDSIKGLELKIIDKYKLEITAKKSLASFDDLLTRIKIAPKHILSKIDPLKLKDLDYSKLAIGSGPLQVASSLEQRDLGSFGIPGSKNFQQLSLQINKGYYGNLAQTNLVIRIFGSSEDLSLALDSGIISASLQYSLAGLNPTKYASSKIPLDSGIFSFFNLKSDNLANKDLRQAMTSSIKKDQLVTLLGAVDPIYSPLPNLDNQPPASTDQPAAVEVLREQISKTGWVYSQASNSFVKDGKDLTLSLVTGDSPLYTSTAQFLKKSWEELGIKINVDSFSNSHLQSNQLLNKDYDILVFGISLTGSTDPYAYWSSQSNKSGGLNFSNYSSKKADTDLDIARTKIDDADRQARLKSFITQWEQDAPAIALYRPSAILYHQEGTIQIDPIYTKEPLASHRSLDFLIDAKTKPALQYPDKAR